MKSHIVILLAALLGVLSVVSADEVKIEFSKKAQKLFADQSPLKAHLVRDNDQIELRLENTSKKHVIITKGAHHWSGDYETKEGFKLIESGAFVPGVPKEFFDHIVLRPAKEKLKGHLSFTSWRIHEMSATHEVASVFVFYLGLSGYFPTIDQYVDFSVSGRVMLETEGGNNDADPKPKSE